MPMDRKKRKAHSARSPPEMYKPAHRQPSRNDWMVSVVPVFGILLHHICAFIVITICVSHFTQCN